MCPTSSQTLLADLDLADGQTDPVIAYLVDPDGQTVSMATNELVTRFSASAPVETPTGAVEVGTTSPEPGLWTLILNFAPTVTGNRLSEPYSGTVSLVAGPASGRPTAGQQQHRPDRRPTGDRARHRDRHQRDAPEDYFIDPRLESTTTLALAPQSPVGAPPAHAGHGVVTLLARPCGHERDDPQRPRLGASDLRLGTRDRRPRSRRREHGRYGGGYLVGHAHHLGCLAGRPVGDRPLRCRPSSQIDGDAGRHGADPSLRPVDHLADRRSLAPVGRRHRRRQRLHRQPGQSAVIPVTITPSAPSGQVVSGTLYVDELTEVLSASANSENFQPGQTYFQGGTQVAALPYRYTVG